MADFPIYRLVKGNTLTFTEMDDNLRWLSRNMSGSIVTITGSAINMSGSVSIIGDVQIAGTASIGFIKSEGYSTGSNQLGDDTSDTQTLIGIVSVSGSMRVSGSTVINNLTGSLFGTASNAVSSSYALSASYAVSSSYAYTASSAISAYTASSSVSSSYAYTASSAISAYTASSAVSSSYAYTASSSVSSSYAYTASSAVSSSYPFRVTGSTIYSYNTSITTGPVGDSKTRSIIIGENAGLGNDRASDSVFIGSNAGSGSNYEESIYIGKNAGVQSVANNSVNIGDYAGYQINGGGTNRNVIIGSYTGYGATNAYYSQFLGTYSGYLATDAYYSNFIGNSTGYQATKANNSIFIGDSSGYNSVSSSYSIFIGDYAGYGGSTSQGLLSAGNNNIIIGNSINLPANSKNAINIGGIIFGSGSYVPTFFSNPFYNSSGSANGKIGINQPNPKYSLDVNGTGNYTGGLVVTGSLIASNISGSLFGTSSWSQNAITASHAESLKIGLNLSASNINVTNNIVANSITAQSASFGYVQTITGSAVIIGQEYIILNTQTPSARYAGLVIYDSGSTSSTSSLVWDSLTNHFVYSNNSGSSYSGGGFIAGPRNSGSFADVTYPTLNKVLRGQGDDHIYDSNITDDNSKVSVSIPVSVTGSVTATAGFTGSLFGTASSAISAYTASSAINSSYALTSSYSTNISGTTNYIPIFTGVNSISTSSIKQSLGSSYSSLEFPASSITGNVANYSDISVFSNESAKLYLYSGPVNNKMSVNLQNAYGTITMLFQSGGFNNDLLSYEGYSTTNKTLTIGGYQGLVINQNGTGHFKSNLAITGSVTATQGFTGSLFGTASRAISSSYALTASYTTNISGTTNYVSKFTGINSLGNSLVYDDGTSVMINTTTAHTAYPNSRLIVNDAADAYLEVRSVNNQSSLVLSKGTSNTSTTPSVEFFNSGNFGIVMYRPGIVSSNYLMYYNSDSVSNRYLSLQTEGSDRLTLNQTGTVRLNSYTTNGFVKFSGSNGTLAVDTTTYQPLLNGSGYVSMSGTNVNYVSTIPNSGLTNSSITIQGSVTSLGGSVNVINGTGFVKASGTSITYDNSTYYLASNPNGYTTNTGTVTSITVSPGTGMSGGGTITTSGTVTLTNTAPDQIVALTQGGTTVITGTYPNFTISSNDQYTGTVTGTGTTNFLPKWTSGSALGNSLVFDNGTNVLVGTTTDGTIGKLQIVGSGGLMVNEDGAGTKVIQIRSNFAGVDPAINVSTNNALLLQTNNTERARFTSGGNLGIGTTSPGNLLSVAGNISLASAGFLGFTGATALTTSNYALYGSSINTYVNVATGGSIGLNIGNNSILTITGSNVGIGTTSPLAKLHLVGELRNSFGSGVGGSNYLNIIDGVSNGFRATITTGNAITYTFHNGANSEVVSILESGNVGIGTTTPGYLLDVAGSSRSDLHIFRSNQSAPTADAFIFRPADNTVALGTANTERLRINSSGNVGIGTTSPISALHVVGDIRAYAGALYLDYTGAVGGIRWRVAPYIGGVSNGGFEIYDETNNVNRFAISSGGNVGIGTTSPSFKLDVNGDAATRGTKYIFQSVGNTTGYLYFDHSGTQVWKQGIFNDNTSTFSIGNAGGFSRLFNITNAGNVGIGTTSPAAKLDVSGSILANNFNSDNAVVNTADTYTGTAKITNIITLTQAEYNAIGSPSSNYLYVII